LIERWLHATVLVPALWRSVPERFKRSRVSPGIFFYISRARQGSRLVFLRPYFFVTRSPRLATRLPATHIHQARGARSNSDSISRITPFVNFGNTSSAPRFSFICSGRVAPVIAELTFGFFKHHASASCARLHPRPSATGFNFFTTSIFGCADAPTSSSLSHSIPGRLARVLGINPLSYLPVSSPLASGQRQAK